MKYIGIIGLMLSLGVGSVNAHERSVQMRISGTSLSSAINLQQPGTSNDEDHFAGEGTFGKFTLRQVRVINTSPDGSGTCPEATQIHLSEPSGAGVFRFSDGSLLTVVLTKGDDCIDVMAGVAQCTITFQVTGGTGRFENASGTLTFTETVKPVLADASQNPFFFAATGEFTGTISRAAEEERRPDEQH